MAGLRVSWGCNGIALHAPGLTRAMTFFEVSRADSDLWLVGMRVIH